MEKYNYNKTEKKWSQKWVEDKTFTPDLKNAKDPYYALFMFPYPSAEGLHIGNFYAFVCTDVMAKYKKLQGKDVFEPFGFDAFGMHLENYALKIGERPQAVEARTTKNFRKQAQSAGLSCDYTREVDTTKPEYYKWTQWLFTKLFEKDLAYQKEALLNWCPSCQTVLADEQIEDGICERCNAQPEKKTMKQWFFRITAYADKMLEGLEDMDWSEITKAAQKNWIGKSEGAEVEFRIKNLESRIKVFTTRPDTLFGVTYMVLATEHSLIKNLKLRIKNYQEVQAYIKKTEAKSELERTENKEKTGVKLEGVYAVNPVNNEKISIWIADYVMMGYGTGAIMAVPAHDERDYEFAKKFDLPIVEVLSGGNIEKEAYIGDGNHINSGFLNGLNKENAIKKITDWLEEKKFGKKEVNYRLRDWCISRQRYWGPPVPVVYCEKCGILSVPEKDLPVMLPETQEWEPSGDGRGPLAKVDEFMNTKCPKCGEPAVREADVMDNFLDSAWYFFRYISPSNSEAIFDAKLGKKWLPVDLYVGGNEHAVLHLMYTRFITMFLHDLDLIDFNNPFKKFRANGMILKDGKKMSKSKGNVISPEEYGKKVGYDALKTYLLFLGPLSEDRSFTDTGVQGTKRWVEKVYKLKEKVLDKYDDSEEAARKLHQTIKVVGENFEEQKYNTAVARLMELTNVFVQAKNISKENWKKYLAIIAPFTPALAEELWREFGNKTSIFSGRNWPDYDKKSIKEETVGIVVQINGKVRDKLKLNADISEADAIKKAKESEKVKKWLFDKEIIKEIYVKGKLVSLAVKD
ncbi:MAG: leucine--tRNA ligase [Patescibacteria group bacterium]|nr:leucine--tRNA ligase [Patescibacteria group bacterium]